MKVYSQKTRPSGQGLGYFQPASPDASGAVNAFSRLGQTLQVKAESRLEKERAEDDARIKKAQHFRALNDFTKFESQAEELLFTQKQTAQPDDPTFRTRVMDAYAPEESKFISNLPPELQDEFLVRAGSVRQRVDQGARTFQFETQNAFYKKGVDDIANTAKLGLQENPTIENLEAWRARAYETIDNADVPDLQKADWKRLLDKDLEVVVYKEELKRGNVQRPNPEGKVVKGSQANFINQGAQELGIDPVDLATAISYETGGKFSTSLWGGKGGNYLGLIQFGPTERERYGVRPGQPFAEQMKAVTSFLKDRGVKPGMGLIDIYSTINAGSPGRYQASDGPGRTVMLHVQAMNQTHRAKAQQIVEGKLLLDGIDHDPSFANIPYEDRIAARRDAEAEQAQEDAAESKQKEAERQGRLNDLYLGLRDGTKGRVEMDEAFEAGDMDYNDLNRADSILAEREKQGADLRYFIDKARNPTGVFSPTSEEDKRGQNAFFAVEGANALATGDQNYVAQQLVPMAVRTGDIASDAAGMLTGMSRSVDPVKQAFALDTMAQLQDQAPAAFLQRFDDKTASDVMLWNSYKNLGGIAKGDKPTDAMVEVMKRIRGGTTQEERQLQAILLEEGKKVITDKNNDNYIPFENVYALAFNPPGFRGAPDFTSMTATSQAALRREFQIMFPEEYARDGNAEEASKRVATRLKVNWGETTVGGQRVTMKYPPEKVGYPMFNQSYDWMDEQLRVERGLAADQRFQLVPDQQTASEVQRWKRGDPNSQAPSYQVVVWDSNGVPYLLPDRQNFDFTPDMAKYEQDKLQVDHERSLLRSWTESVFTPAVEYAAQTGTAVPDDIEEEAKQRRELVEMMDKQLKETSPEPKVTRPELNANR